MGVSKTVGAERFPEQGSFLNREVVVMFDYKAATKQPAVCVRDDREDPFLAIFRLEDGRHVLATECQYSPL